MSYWKAFVKIITEEDNEDTLLSASWKFILSDTKEDERLDKIYLNLWAIQCLMKNMINPEENIYVIK